MRHSRARSAPHTEHPLVLPSQDRLRKSPFVFGLSVSDEHAFSKQNRQKIQLLPGLGVEGDAHCGELVKHRSRVAKDPNQPNLRQVHLLHAELLDELGSNGFRVMAGQIGENITTRNIDLLGLPTGARLQIGPSAEIEVTGLRNPCKQLDAFHDGLMEAVLETGPAGELIRKAGVMAIVIKGGPIEIGDAIRCRLPDGVHQPLAPV